MPDQQPQAIKLQDYQVPPFLIEQVDLDFDLYEEATRVRATLHVQRNEAAEDKDAPLVLDGEGLELNSLTLDGRALREGDYRLGKSSLTLADVPDRFTLVVENTINPAANTRLEGLYLSGGNFCTQCEAEGFRWITYYPDRPDVMAPFTVTLHADKAHYPVLLSNGNLTGEGDEEAGDGARHWARWEDPFPKPSYLFALVAGDLAKVEDRFTTRSGREVALRVYVEHGNEAKAAYTMDSLIRSMRWDEERFGLEYDLDVFNIVAVSDFNLGAMENKSLNIFNSKYVLADAETATDTDFANIESIVAHEYFHNWTGNRVTCRDWFQLSLKEGLTVFRDQEFSADMRSAPVKRIQDVRTLRARQFPEDAGPMAHPVRPESYIEINNFYTPTVYEKGAEVIRMMQEILGREGFRKGIDLYFERHDGQAVTCDDFAAAMADANGVDLTHFKRWYSQAGTPVVEARWLYDPDREIYELTLSQHCDPTPGQPHKEPLHIPVSVGLVGEDGADLPLVLEGENEIPEPGSRTLHLTEREQKFRFVGVKGRPVPSINRGFSAPVKLKAPYSDADLAFLMGRDSDPFNRWEAAQNFACGEIMRLVDAIEMDKRVPLNSGLSEAMRANIENRELDHAFLAQMMALPSLAYVADQMAQADYEAIHKARTVVKRKIAEDLREELLALYRDHSDGGDYSPDAASAGRRAVKNAALAYLAALEGDEASKALVVEQYQGADNMTDRMAALALLNDMDCPEREEALAAFEARFGGDALVMDKWFVLQALSTLPDTPARVSALQDHPAFVWTNPNKVRSLIGAFSSANPLRFHAGDGAGYRLLADAVIRLNGINPQVAARILGPLGTWRRVDQARQGLMKAELRRILAVADLSKDVYEVASKSLGE